jgi:hypothetical protein
MIGFDVTSQPLFCVYFFIFTVFLISTSSCIEIFEIVAPLSRFFGGARPASGGGNVAAEQRWCSELLQGKEVERPRWSCSNGYGDAVGRDVVVRPAMCGQQHGWFFSFGGATR